MSSQVERPLETPGSWPGRRLVHLRSSETWRDDVKSVAIALGMGRANPEVPMLWCASAGGEAPGKHAVATSPPKSCPGEGETCVTWHMTQVVLTGGRCKFMDHMYRIA